MFKVEFAIHVRHKTGWATFRKEGQLPFAPFTGLDILDEYPGQFTLTHVAWDGTSQLFLCQSTLDMPRSTFRSLRAPFLKSKWIEDEDARQGLNGH